MSNKSKLFDLWASLYPGDNQQRLEQFLEALISQSLDGESFQADWYKDAVVYSLYVDLFSNDFKSLTEKLDYLKGLGVSCLWLLPILDSPMRDAGFDIRNYDQIRPELLGLEENSSVAEREEVFGKFLAEAHNHGIRVIFDVAINHCSEEHPWFVEAKKSEDNPYRDYFIWSRDKSLYRDARIIFKGMETSNWEPFGDSNFFHRFFNFQPDLNYKNPEVLLAMCRNLLYWQSLGVDGFRADAIPYLWKEEGTDCENLPQTHSVVKFFRAILDYVKPGTLLLAEACQVPETVVKYMGDDDECHAAYHFPLMPMFYKSIALHSSQPVRNILNPSVTPSLPENGQWFTFLRCHDELSLELVYVTEEDRKYIHESYCHEPEWNFRLGEGISARLANLFQFDDRRIGLAYSMMLSLPGTPVIYYGDEFGKENDVDYYKEMIKLVGKDDTRFLVRGKINWDKRELQLADKETFQAKVFSRIQKMLFARNKWKVFGRGSITFLNLGDLSNVHNDSILAYYRKYEHENILVIQNLSDESQEVILPSNMNSSFELINEKKIPSGILRLEPYAYFWLRE
ncbi:MAG: alpha-amylase [Bacteroidetes bacterium HGW-Bacteroidetes-1]|jgi:maltose alpha-D-glucosyltransferase/alpha-amylase|nr:MAG: alpha-amylase [Bacteroidetes bacterium HGW-Bacteroidetes-1]